MWGLIKTFLSGGLLGLAFDEDARSALSSLGERIARAFTGNTSIDEEVRAQGFMDNLVAATIAHSTGLGPSFMLTLFENDLISAELVVRTKMFHDVARAQAASQPPYLPASVLDKNMPDDDSVYPDDRARSAYRSWALVTAEDEGITDIL